MTRFIVIAALLVGVVGIAIYGCGPRAQVAKDAIIDKLDKALGELNVKRKKIEMKQNELRNKLDALKKSRYLSEAKLDLMKEKRDKSQSALDSIMGKVEDVKALVSEAQASDTKTIERNDKTYTADQIAATAQQVAGSAKAEQTKLAGFKASYEAMEKAVSVLKSQETTAVKLMADLEQKVSEIDAKKIAVDAVKEASSITGGESIGDDFAALQKEIEDLGVNVDAALKMETDKMTELDSANSLADEILSEATGGLDNAEKMLDDLLK